MLHQWPVRHEIGTEHLKTRTFIYSLIEYEQRQDRHRTLHFIYIHTNNVKLESGKPRNYKVIRTSVQVRLWNHNRTFTNTNIISVCLIIYDTNKLTVKNNNNKTYIGLLVSRLKQQVYTWHIHAYSIIWWWFKIHFIVWRRYQKKSHTAQT